MAHRQKNDTNDKQQENDQNDGMSDYTSLFAPMTSLLPSDAIRADERAVPDPFPEFPTDPYGDLSAMNEIEEDLTRSEELRVFLQLNTRRLNDLKRQYHLFSQGIVDYSINCNLDDIYVYILEWDAILETAAFGLANGREFLRRYCASRSSSDVSNQCAKAAHPNTTPGAVNERMSDNWPKNYAGVIQYLLEVHGIIREHQSLRKAATQKHPILKSYGERKNRRFDKIDVDRYVQRKKHEPESETGSVEETGLSKTIEYCRMTEDQLVMLIEDIQQYEHGDRARARFVIEQTIPKFVDTHFHRTGEPPRRAPKIHWYAGAPLNTLAFLIVALAKANIIVVHGNLPEFALAHFARSDLNEGSLKLATMRTEISTARSWFKDETKDRNSDEYNNVKSLDYGDWMLLVHQHIEEFL